MSDIESKLFHYTTLEGLTYILSSKSIRFSRLDKVNDVDEGASANYDETNEHHGIHFMLDRVR